MGRKKSGGKMRGIPKDGRLLTTRKAINAQSKAQRNASDDEVVVAEANAERLGLELEEMLEAGLSGTKRYSQVEWSLNHWNTRAKEAASRSSANVDISDD